MRSVSRLCPSSKISVVKKHSIEGANYHNSALFFTTTNNINTRALTLAHANKNDKKKCQKTPPIHRSISVCRTYRSACSWR